MNTSHRKNPKMFAQLEYQENSFRLPLIYGEYWGILIRDLNYMAVDHNNMRLIKINSSWSMDQIDICWPKDQLPKGKIVSSALKGYGA